MISGLVPVPVTNLKLELSLGGSDFQAETHGEGLIFRPRQQVRAN